MAAEAVRVYGEHLSAIGVEISSADRGHRVLDRFFHALTVGDTDDDLRLTDTVDRRTSVVDTTDVIRSTRSIMTR